MKTTERLSPVVGVARTGNGRGHELYAEFVVQAASLVGLDETEDISHLVWKENGTPLQWILAQGAEFGYQSAGWGGNWARAYRAIREKTTSRSPILRLANWRDQFSRDKTVYAVQAYTSPRLPGHGIVIGDAVTDRAAIDGVSTVFVPTADQHQYLVNGGGHDNRSAIHAGFLVSPEAQSDELFNRKIKRLESGDPVGLAFLFTGQRPLAHQKVLFSAIAGIKQLMAEGQIKNFSVYTAGDEKLAARVKVVMPEAKVMAGKHNRAGILLSVALLEDADVVVSMPCERVGYNAVTAMIDLESFNNNSLGDKLFNDQNKLTVGAEQIATLEGLDKVLHYHLVTLKRRELVDNMLVARNLMDIRGIQRIGEHMADQPRVQERLKIRGK